MEEKDTRWTARRGGYAPDEIPHGHLTRSLCFASQDQPRRRRREMCINPGMGQGQCQGMEQGRRKGTIRISVASALFQGYEYEDDIYTRRRMQQQRRTNKSRPCSATTKCKSSFTSCIQGCRGWGWYEPTTRSHLNAHERYYDSTRIYN